MGNKNRYFVQEATKLTLCLHKNVWPYFANSGGLSAVSRKL